MNELTFVAAEENTTFTARDTVPYYLYLRVYPNLSAFIVGTKFIYTYMPCTILYSMHFSVTCYESAE